MISTIAALALISIAINVWYAFWRCTVKKNKHYVGEYIFVRTIGGPVLAMIEKIMWESSVPPLIDGPIYYVFYVDTEKYNVDNLAEITDVLGCTFRDLLENIKDENREKDVDVDGLSLMLSYLFTDSIGQREAANTVSLVYILQEKHHIPKEDIYREIRACLKKKFDVQEGK